MTKEKPWLSPLKAMVNQPLQWKAFDEMIEHQINAQQRTLEQATDLQQMFKAQGAIAALRHLKCLKEEINGLSK
jgi:hypothetical protein